MSGGRHKALFLDRDGVINFDAGHTFRREEFEFIPGIFELCRAAQAAGYLLVVVTNQAGIGRGKYSEEDFQVLTEWMIDRFAQEGSRITRLYFCPYHPEFGVGKYKQDSPDRKPHPGMLLRAQAELDLDLSASIFIGDKLTDMQAGQAAGVGTKILLSIDGTAWKERGTACYTAGSLDEIRKTFFSNTERVLGINTQAGSERTAF